MRKEVGIWLDTNKAVLVSLMDGNNETVQVLESEVESRTRFPGEKKNSRIGSLLTKADDNKVANRKKQQKHHYYQEIMKHVGSEVNALYLFGPSKAKIELEKELKENTSFSNLDINVESADKMTEKQMIARVKSYFETQKNGKHDKVVH
ncbi:hypothetical protein [Alkalitalea saponilacus]|uniref:Protein required for attachment to host cells n=1 Tax=Alkalitalea saponilacus TaxID=889453 RepID=A0A1T5HC74_9BACT|nr:hypothetical protein [Alkalitalea saponilacus]ASB50758.1 hypothetical protein CDL62_17170 [Alkalitalea saponilacus]SKC18283.1 hypothetical protein SAMN03080601_02225 [Alkalitalea saponilacus]